jgi:D-tyrosyl-tRNA(Tyr) deacylase
VRAVLQRVREAAVHVDGAAVARIGPGLLALVAVAREDSEAALDPFAQKVSHLRLFADADSHFSRSLLDTGGELLLVPQFTLYGDVRRGRRPDFTRSASGEAAEPLFAALAERFRRLGVAVQTGRFGASMQVALVNDGPVTIIVDM